jgi:hypothetical protein
VAEQSIQLRFDSARRLVQRALGRRAQQHIQTHGKDSLVTTLHGVPQAFGVFEPNVALGIGDTLREHVDSS